MVYLQLFFISTTICFGYIGWVMCRIHKRHPLPGVAWWAGGCWALGLTTFLVAVSVYLGEWAKTFLAHVFMIGGFGALWIGTRLFLGYRLRRMHYVACFILLFCVSILFFWCALVDPMHQVRLTLSCVVLLLVSLAISQTLFSAKVEQGTVTAAGVFYSIFAFINGLRTINIILFPNVDSYYLSDSMALILTSLMVPVLIAALLAQLLMIGDEINLSLK